MRNPDDDQPDVPVLADLAMARMIHGRIQAQLDELGQHLGHIEKLLAGGMPDRARAADRRARR